MLLALSNSSIPLRMHTLLLNGLKSAELRVLVKALTARRSDAHCLCDPSFRRDQTW